MRMKKIILIAAVAIAAAACSKTFDTNPAASQKAISFGSWSENLTKAGRTQGSSTFVADDTFSVSGNKATTSPAAKVTVFNNEKVTAEGTGTLTWKYDVTRFWDTNYDSYTFYAVSPFGAATIDAQDGTIAATDIVYAGNDKDILVADKVVVNKTDGANYFNGYGTVELTFKHISTLVDVKMKKSHALANNKVTVKAFAINNVLSAGTFAVTTYPTIDWTKNTPKSYYPADGVTSVDISSPIEIVEDNTFDSSNTDPDKVPAGSTTLINNLVVMPQAISAQTITLTYNIEGDPVDHEVELFLKDFDKVDNGNQNQTKVGNWEAGKHYTFYITIDAHAIVFDASIESWDNVIVNGYHYILN